MQRPSSNQPPSWLGLVNWLPVLIYFLVKYVVVGRENMTTRQSILLIAAVILAEIALWQYRKQFYKSRKPTDDGADQE